MADNWFTKLTEMHSYVKENYSYGMLYDGKCYKEDSDFIMDNYRSLSPDQLNQNKCGICFDFSFWWYDYLHKHHIYSSVVNTVLSTDNGEFIQIHSFPVIPYHGYYVFVESSSTYDDIGGIFIYEKIEDYLNKWNNIVNENRPDECPPLSIKESYILKDYIENTKIKSPYNLTFNELMKYTKTHARYKIEPKILLANA